LGRDAGCVGFRLTTMKTTQEHREGERGSRGGHGRREIEKQKARKMNSQNAFGIIKRNHLWLTLTRGDKHYKG